MPAMLRGAIWTEHEDQSRKRKQAALVGWKWWGTRTNCGLYKPIEHDCRPFVVKKEEERVFDKMEEETEEEQLLFTYDNRRIKKEEED